MAAGSGKTSLVNALAGRLPADAHGAQVGEVLLNGRERQKNFRRMTSYVMQVRGLLADACPLYKNHVRATMAQLSMRHLALFNCQMKLNCRPCEVEPAMSAYEPLAQWLGSPAASVHNFDPTDCRTARALAWQPSSHKCNFQKQ